MQQQLFSKILIPTYEGLLKRRKIFRYWRELERSQWLGPKELEALQFAALRRLVDHAAAHCPYYRQAWREHGLAPHQLQAPEDFRRWPVLDRDTIRANRLRMRPEGAGLRLLQKATGGSNGTPLHFDLDLDSHDRRTAAWYRGYGWAGAVPGTKQLFLWGVALTGQTPWKRCKDRLYNWLYRRRLLNTFGLSDERAPRYLEELNRYRPDVLVAYAYSLYVFARWLKDRQLRPFSPRAIVVGAEKLYRFQRQLVEEVFQAPVFETYGSREFMLMAAECDRHEGMHLTLENLFFEVLDDQGRPTPEGEEGNLVVTDLYNYGMPFLRYANGDRVVAGWPSCSCGRGLPLLKEVCGRRSDMVHTPDGRHVTGLVFPHLLKDFPAVRRFLVVQDRPDHIQLHLVVGPNWDEAGRRLLEQAVGDVLGPTIQVEFRLVDDIPLTLAGKHRVVINQCTPGHRPQVPSETVTQGLVQKGSFHGGTP